MNLRNLVRMALVLSAFTVVPGAHAEQPLCSFWGPPDPEPGQPSQLEKDGFFSVRCFSGRQANGTVVDGELVGSLTVCRLNSEYGARWCDLDFVPDSDLLYVIGDVEPDYQGCQDVRCGGTVIPNTNGPSAFVSATREPSDDMDQYFTWTPGRAFYVCSCYDDENGGP